MSEGDGAGWRWPFVRDERGFWTIAAVLLGAVSFLRGIHYPNRWSATQALINYDFGLVKRGLFGATFGNWLHLERYLRFSLFSYFLLMVLLGLLVLLVRQSGAMRKLGMGEPVAVFFASYAVTYLASLAGYLDILLAILTLALLLIRDARLRAAAALPLCITGLLIHEMFLFVSLPVLLFSFIADGFKLRSRKERTGIWAAGVLVAMVSVGMTMWLALERPMTERQLDQLRTEIERKADFPVSPGVFEVLLRSSGDNARIMKRNFRNRAWLTLSAARFIGFLPTLALLLIAIRLAVQMAAPRELRRPLLTCALIAALSPMLMYLFGWDSARWDALLCLEAFLVLMVLARSLPEDSPLPARGEVLWGNYRYLSILAIALSMATGGMLLDGKRENTFPFLLDAQGLAEDLQQHGWVAPDR